MNKFLFTDGLNGVQQAASAEELETRIESSSEKDRIRIWVYNTNEWISVSAYRKQFPATVKRPKVPGDLSGKNARPLPPVSKKLHWSKKLVYTTMAAAGIFLIFNFTRIKWQAAAALSTSAVRPANMPGMDIDSLISEIETDRGQTLDRSTRTNLRLRNTWPDRILLQLSADRETSTAGTRYSNLNISIDNTTGFPLDQAVVRLLSWKNNKASVEDTFHFNSVRFEKLSNRLVDQKIKADSLSVDFQSIRAKAFNFAYSVSVKNEPGQYTDRWFSRD
jgi:hypothetical protein